MTLWYHMCFMWLLCCRTCIILENATQPCCSIAVKMLTITHNAGYSQVLWLPTERSKTCWLTCFSGCTGVHSNIIIMIGPYILYTHTYTDRFQVHIVIHTVQTSGKVNVSCGRCAGRTRHDVSWMFTRECRLFIPQATRSDTHVCTRGQSCSSLSSQAGVLLAFNCCCQPIARVLASACECGRGSPA